MKNFSFIVSCILLISCKNDIERIPVHFKEVDQVIWVVEDMNKVIPVWKNLGFTQITDPDTTSVKLNSHDEHVTCIMAKGNLGGARITWIQPLEERSVFAKFHSEYGDGAMSLVHRFKSKQAMDGEVGRLSDLGIEVLEGISFLSGDTESLYVFMDTGKEGKYILGYTYSDSDSNVPEEENIHNMEINQYAFAIRDPEPVSDFWLRLGLPEFQISYPELDNMHYYGEPTDHELIQGWQRHGTVSYEWCIPVKPPIVYEDHINLHGEGIHHLAFTVQDMDSVLNDYLSKGYVNSMGGTWGEAGKNGSGRYEYIDLEDAGGVTMELLWNFK